MRENPIRRAGEIWAEFVCRRPLVILGIAFLLTLLALKAVVGLTVSTRIEDLMPAGAKSVQALNMVLEKTGSFASINIVVHTQGKAATLAFLGDAKHEIDQLDWVSFSQYAEDIEFLSRHKLLLLNEKKLLDIEHDVEDAYPTLLAQQLAKVVGADVSLSIRDENLHGDSRNLTATDQIDELAQSLREAPQKTHYFTTEDGLTGVLVIWPKAGLESLNSAKRMVGDATTIAKKLSDAEHYDVTSGVAGRIANKVAQFDAVTGDLRVSLLSAITLIALLIGLYYRSIFAIPAILIPLCAGLVWTFGMASIAIGGLNLITVFLVLILFGLGIDFGIHNFSRYREERQKGCSVDEAMRVVIVDTGGASVLAALTTSFGFLALMLTKFRAFSEFGFIAGAGIIMIFLAMYSICPALIVVFQRLCPEVIARHRREDAPIHRVVRKQSWGYALPTVVIAICFAVVFAPKITFERNFKNLEASQPSSLVWATNEASQIFGSSHDRAMIAVDTLEELAAIDSYFEGKILNDTKTPTIEKISSVFDFVPPSVRQKRRLEVIMRLKKQAAKLKSVDHDLYRSVMQYLDIGVLDIDNLPKALRRTFTGPDDQPGYLLYIYNSVSMDDARLARQFYDDASTLTVGGREYHSASEGFVFVEMIALMKRDAVRAILLVVFVTVALLLAATRNLAAAMVILAPAILGVVVTIAIMGAIGLPLSIMNMVILPSLIGIAVDNAIHIFHRFRSEGRNADIAQVMRTTGRAAVLTTLTTLVGFGGLVTASMGGLKSMGFLAIIGFSTCLALTWLVLPGLLKVYRSSAERAGNCFVTN